MRSYNFIVERNESVQRVPVGLAQGFERSAGFGGGAVARSEDLAPTGRRKIPFHRTAPPPWQYEGAHAPELKRDSSGYGGSMREGSRRPSTISSPRPTIVLKMPTKRLVLFRHSSTSF